MARRRAALPTLPTPPPAGPSGARLNGLFGELAGRGRMRTVPLDAIAPNPGQPRKQFDSDALQALADSIRERGVLQPPVVRDLGEGHYELIAGERRARASRLAGLSEIEVILKDSDRAGSLQDALLENVARADLSPIEKARAYASLVEDLGLTREAIGRQLGESRMNISNYIRLLDLPDDVLDLIDGGQLTYVHGRALLLCSEQATRRDLARRAVQEGWSTRQLEHAARAKARPPARKPRRASTADRDALVGRMTDRVNAHTAFVVAIKAGPKDTYAFVVSGSAAARAIAEALGAEGLDQPL
jgi:ParB family transcriptional regulator, chromosome partitioning protein